MQFLLLKILCLGLATIVIAAPIEPRDGEAGEAGKIMQAISCEAQIAATQAHCIAECNKGSKCITSW